MRCTINHFFYVIAKAILLVFLLCAPAWAAQASLAQPATKRANVNVNFDAPSTGNKSDSNTPIAPSTEKTQQTKKTTNPSPKSDDKENDDQANIYLNFENASLGSVFNYLAEQKKINTLPQGDLEEQKVSLTTRNPLTLDRAWNVLLTLLEMNGFSLVKVGDLHRIVSNKDNGREPLPSYSSRKGTEPEDLPNSDLVVRYTYFFKNMQAEVAQSILTTMLEGDGAVQVNQDLQVCIMKEKCFNIKAAMRIVKELDTGGLREGIKIIQLQEADSEAVETLFKEVLGSEDESRRIRFINKASQQDKSYFSSATKIFAYPAKNSIILLGMQKNIERITDFIYKHIDVPIGTAQSRIHIKEVRYAKSENLKPILENIVKPPAGQGSEKSPVVGKFKFFEDVIIAAEGEGQEAGRGSGNRLVIACNQEDWVRLEKFIDKLDKPQAQVAFEVMIIDVTLDQAKELGAQFQNKQGNQIGMGLNSIELTNLSSGADLVRNQVPAGSEEVGMKNLIDLTTKDNLGQGYPSFLTLGKTGIINGMRESNIWAIVRSVFKTENTHIIGQPYIVTNNGQPCFIEVTEQRRVDAGLRSERGEQVRTTKEPLDAATRVDLTPQINSDGIIDLSIKIQLDSFESTDPNKEANKSTRNIETRANIAAGEVLVLGGLKVSGQTISLWKTPILGDIPIIGNLFKSKTKAKTEKNLYVFIRPSVIKPKFEGAPDEYTQLKLDYAKLQMMKNDLYIKDSDPIQRWFFRPTNYSVKQTIADAKIGRMRPIDKFTYGQNTPKLVNIQEDPYFKDAESLAKQRELKQRRRNRFAGAKVASIDQDPLDQLKSRKKKA